MSSSPSLIPVKYRNPFSPALHSNAERASHSCPVITTCETELETGLAACVERCRALLRSVLRAVFSDRSIMAAFVTLTTRLGFAARVAATAASAAAGANAGSDDDGRYAAAKNELETAFDSYAEYAAIAFAAAEEFQETVAASEDRTTDDPTALDTKIAELETQIADLDRQCRDQRKKNRDLQKKNKAAKSAAAQ